MASLLHDHKRWSEVNKGFLREEKCRLLCEEASHLISRMALAFVSVLSITFGRMLECFHCLLLTGVNSSLHSCDCKEIKVKR